MRARASLAEIAASAGYRMVCRAETAALISRKEREANDERRGNQNSRQWFHR